MTRTEQRALKANYRGELYNHDGKGMACLGNIYKVEDGYVVRECLREGGIGGVIFDGRIFQGVDFARISDLHLSASQTVKRYMVRNAA